MYTLLVIILLVVLMLPDILRCFTQGNQTAERFNATGTDPMSRLVWIRSETQEATSEEAEESANQFISYKKNIRWETPTNPPLVSTSTPSGSCLNSSEDEESDLPCQKKNSCQVVYDQTVYNSCISKGGRTKQCGCCNYCKCVDMGGDLTRCLEEPRYQDCLNTNQDMNEEAAVAACKTV